VTVVVITDLTGERTDHQLKYSETL